MVPIAFILELDTHWAVCTCTERKDCGQSVLMLFAFWLLCLSCSNTLAFRWSIYAHLFSICAFLSPWLCLASPWGCSTYLISSDGHIFQTWTPELTGNDGVENGKWFEAEHLMRFTGWFEDLWKQHRQDHQSLALGQSREFPGNLLCQWHGESLGHEGDCDAFQEPRQEFSVSQNGDILCVHTNLGTLPCLSAAWAFRSPTAQLSFVSPQLLDILMLLLPSKSSKCFLTTSKSPIWSYFPVQKSPKCLSHHMCICHSAGFSFSTVISVPPTTYSGPHNIKLVFGFLN